MHFEVINKTRRKRDVQMEERRLEAKSTYTFAKKRKEGIAPDFSF
jgi:hypothetical protein